MRFDEMRIMDAVTGIAFKASETWTSEKKKSSISSIISHTLELMKKLIASEPERFKSIAELEQEALVYFCIFAEMCSVKQYSSLPKDRWDKAAKDTCRLLCSELLQGELALLLNKPQSVIDRLKFVFSGYKLELIGQETLNNVVKWFNEYANKKENSKEDHGEGSSDGSNYISADVQDETIARFIITYDPFGQFNWEQVLREILKSEKNNEYQRQKNKRTDSLDSNGRYNYIVSEPFKDPEEEPIITVIKKFDMLRDMFITPKKLGITNIQLKYYRCFFTDDISYAQEESETFFRHIRSDLKAYSAPGCIDIDFLNFFVDAECEVITDAYRKPRKQMSLFKDNCDPSGRCRQPLEQIVFAKYLKRDVSSVSPKQTAYDQLKQQNT